MEQPHLARRLKAILLADVVGYSRLMNLDESGTHLKVNNYTKELIGPKIREHGGRLIRTMGDGFLAEFDSAADAVSCGLKIQEGLRTDDAAGSDPRIWLRIGINTGDVIADDRDIYGHSVNIAARLEGLAEPGEVYVSRAVRDQLEGQSGLSFEDRGERRVKNIKTPIHVYRVKRAEAPPHFLIALAQRFSLARLRLNVRVPFLAELCWQPWSAWGWPVSQFGATNRRWHPGRQSWSCRLKISVATPEKITLPTRSPTI